MVRRDAGDELNVEKIALSPPFTETAQRVVGPPHLPLQKAIGVTDAIQIDDAWRVGARDGSCDSGVEIRDGVDPGVGGRGAREDAKNVWEREALAKSKGDVMVPWMVRLVFCM